MNIYVGGKTQDLETVKLVQGIVKACGHKITYDWVEIIEKHGGDSNEVDIDPKLTEQYAMNDLGGVYIADLVIAIGHPNLCGTLWECGMAVAFNHPLWLLYWDRCSRHSVFENLPHVTFIEHTQELADRLWEISKKESGRDDPPSVKVLEDSELEIVRNGETLGG